ncbi:transposase [Benzoatithermus flavus]|uniref:transposase n=1 Tax=Benzoatithermus flavus TaxID=3108223 RepID=UPI003AABC470
MRTVLQEVLETEMTDAPGVAERERTAGRLGCRAGGYGRTLIIVNGAAIDRQAGAAGSRAPLAIRAGTDERHCC